jgi:hypothetical protein
MAGEEGREPVGDGARRLHLDEMRRTRDMQGLDAWHHLHEAPVALHAFKGRLSPLARAGRGHVNRFRPEPWLRARGMLVQARMKAFWFLWGVDALTALVAVYFFFVGLADGSVSSFNIGIWSALLLGLGGVVFGSLALRSAGRDAWARALVTALAVPALGIGLFFAVLLLAHPRWN